MEEYISQEEYPSYFVKLNGLRTRIAVDLPLESAARILDLATGYGFFALEIARCYVGVQIIGIDIAPDDVTNAADRVAKSVLTNRITVKEMDSTQMHFPDRSFDAVVNFLGLEDIHMTRGKAGLDRTFTEVNRVLKPKSYFCFTGMPPDEIETEAQKTELALFSYTCGCTWLTSDEYVTMLKDKGFYLKDRKVYRTGKKLTSNQAREEIRFACENVPRIYGLSTASFEDVWSRFGKSIEQHGMGHYSRVVLFIAQKM